ncbi:hypothetical protein JCM3766R1_005979 [Sporobolomyces carnicolor]
MDVKAATDSKPAFRVTSLLSLPDELLQAIFKAGGPDFRVPLACKRFVPFYRAQINYESIYRTIKIKSDKALSKLARTLSWNPSHGGLVRDLVIVAKGQIAVDQVEAMLNRLPNLVTLAIVDSGGRVCDGFLKADSAKCGPNLEHLHLEADRVQKMVEDPFSTANLTALARRTKLSKLELIFGLMPYPSNPAPFTTEQVALPALKSIALSGDLTRAAPAFKFLIAHSKPSVVVLDDSSRHPRLTDVLSEFRQDLVQFKNLIQLSLSGGALSGASSPFYTALRKLSALRTLTFGPLCDVSATALSNLVSGNKIIDGMGEKKPKHPTLTKLQLDNISAKEGSYVIWKDDHDWMFPKWTSKFTLKGRDKLIESARQGRVELTGTVLSTRNFGGKFKRALAEAQTRRDEARWVAEERDCDIEEAYDILLERDEKEAREEYEYYAECDGYNSDGWDDEEDDKEDLVIWRT